MSQKHEQMFSSVQFSCSVVSDSLWLHGLQQARPPCPSPTPRVYSNSCRLNQWCHPTISSSVIPFSSCLHLSKHQGFFRWVSSTHQVAKVLEFQLQHQSVLQMNIQDWFPLGWTGWISLLSKELSRVFSTSQLKSINSSVLSFLYNPTLTSVHDYWKNHSFDVNLCWQSNVSAF